MENVEALIRENSLALTENLGSISAIELARPFEQHRASGIVSFTTPGRDSVEIYRALVDRKVGCAIRGEAIRLSPHFYQAGKPLQNILDLVADTVT